ncbi:PspC domain protein [Bacillus phage phIS3501]|uniref:PspC domain protein n=1 Tax=Bacillus phage phIS3501 TaxID=1124578 RepID=H0UST8_9CAUD|nr:PspC domain protein [Bacillus phage phIS3501]AEV89271.1 PspC domain protein [Bacillus phage phIS3501]
MKTCFPLSFCYHLLSVTLRILFFLLVIISHVIISFIFIFLIPIAIVIILNFTFFHIHFLRHFLPISFLSCFNLFFISCSPGSHVSLFCFSSR